MRPHPRAPLLTIVFIALATVAARADAADAPLAIEARGGLGLGSMLSQWQRDRGYQSGFVPDLRPALRIDPTLAAELALESWIFPRDHGGSGRATLFGVGGRFDPRLMSWLTWFLDAHAGLALTGPANRFMFDLGTGLDFWATRTIAAGPYLRYGQIVGHGADPRFWAGGVSVTVTFGPSGDEPPALGGNDRYRDERQREWERTRQRERQAVAPSRPDRDHDGVADEIDICPDEPQGSRPDPAALGCPKQEARPAAQIEPQSIEAHPKDVDSDGDGVPDRDDQCPDRPFGKYPDPMQLGCPLPDRDHDGIPDIFDACPNKRGRPNAKARKNGCASSGRADRPGAVPFTSRDPWA